MSEKKNQKRRTVYRELSDGSGKKIRKIKIQDARNSWELQAVVTDKIKFDLKGFMNYHFTFDGENIEGFKRHISRDSDSGKLSAHEDRFNLIDDNGNRKTIRMTNLKKHLKRIFQ